MKKLLIFIYCATLLFMTACASKSKDNDQRLWYNKPAQHWLEALPLGNSHMGAMIYGGTMQEEIQLNEETFWSGGPHNNNSSTALQYLPQVRQLIFDGKDKEAADLINREFIKGPHGMRYLTLGSIMLTMDDHNATVEDYERELDLQTAVSTTTFKLNGHLVTRTAFASMKDSLVVMKIKAEKKGALNFVISHKCQLSAFARTDGNQLIANIRGVEHEGVPAGLEAEMRVQVETDGKITDQTSELHVGNATEVTLYISAATNFVNYHDITGNASSRNRSILASATKQKYNDLLKHHIEQYQKQYNRVKLQLGSDTISNKMLPTDQRLDSFYGSQDQGMVSLLFNYGRYLLISSSQGKNGQAANLQGVWNDKLYAPWDSKYTININAEMNYWPAEVCNISETAEPLFSMIRDLSETGARTAKTMYGCRGWMAHHNTDIWRIAGPVDGAFWGMFPNGGAWLATHLWTHYEYTLDKDFLAEYYPIMKGAADFYLDFLQEDPHSGCLVAVPSVSPEHGGRGKSTPICAGCTMDNQIVYDALHNTLEAAAILGLDAQYQDTLKQVIARLPKMKVGQYGQLQEWMEDVDDPRDQHRHISHLYGLYPSNQISAFNTPDLFVAAGRTLEQRGDQATGWSLGWKTNFWARMLDGNHAYKIISNMLRLIPSDDRMRDYPNGRTYPNLFDAHPPFQIDGNFGATAGIAEMLLQSELINGKEGYSVVHLLPALPDAWSEGQVSGLKARGGHEVSIKWSKGVLTSATIASKESGRLVIRSTTRLKDLRLIKEYPSLGIFEYEATAVKGKSITITGTGESMQSVEMSTAQGRLKVSFVTPSIARIQCAVEGDSLNGNNTGVRVEREKRNFAVSTKVISGQLALCTDSLWVTVNPNTFALTYIDPQTGKKLLSENAIRPREAERVAIEKVTFDEKSARTVKSADGNKLVKDETKRDTIGYTFRYRTHFTWQDAEALYGLGAHMEDYMNLRGKLLYLTQHNLKAMVPVLNSTAGYGLLFDAGCAMKFSDTADGSYMEMEAARELDYYFMKGENLDRVIGQYRYLTGDCPMMPRYLFGYTQSKERYCSQHEIIEVLSEYRRRQVPIDMIVQDWNYWPEGWGYMKMDPKHYPDPKGLADTVHSMNAHLMVSIWPNPQYCPQAEDFKNHGYMLEHSVYDVFNPEARDYYWGYADREFFSKGFDAWWCDCSEPLDKDWRFMRPGYGWNDQEERWQLNTSILSEALGAERSTLYSLYHSMGIYEHQRAAQVAPGATAKRVVNLTRSSYAGQQRYSTITWNGDTHAAWDSYRQQIPAGLNFMATGCPYWSVDVGSFFVRRGPQWFAAGEFQNGVHDMGYREYYTRMFQWGTFLPMLRSHGTETPREIWRFGEPGTPFYDAILAMIHLRYRMLPYTYSLAAKTTMESYTMARALAFDFASDTTVLDIKDQFMFGPAFLVCPVTEPLYYGPNSVELNKADKSRQVYLPKGEEWIDFWTGKHYKGGQWMAAEATIDRLPLFVRAGSIIPMGPVLQYSSEPTDTPTELRIYPGKDCDFVLYDDGGDGYDCEKGAYSQVAIHWNEADHSLSLADRKGSFPGMKAEVKFLITLPEGMKREVTYNGKAMTVKL